MRSPFPSRIAALTTLAICGLLADPARAQQSPGTLTGQAAFTDYTKESPGVRRKLTVADYHGWAFATEHGSWNKERRAGYKVIAVPIKDGHATGEYEDFLTGFVTSDGQVWGRPVGVAVARDGSLFVSDDGSKTVWHVMYTGAKAAP